MTLQLTNEEVERALTPHDASIRSGHAAFRPAGGRAARGRLDPAAQVRCRARSSRNMTLQLTNEEVERALTPHDASIRSGHAAFRPAGGRAARGRLDPAAQVRCRARSSRNMTLLLTNEEAERALTPHDASIRSGHAAFRPAGGRAARGRLDPAAQVRRRARPSRNMTLLPSTRVRNYGGVFPCVGRTPLSARDAAVLMKNAPRKPARGPAAVQGDRPTLLSSAPDSLPYFRTGVRSNEEVGQALHEAGPPLEMLRPGGLIPLPKSRAGRALLES